MKFRLIARKRRFFSWKRDCGKAPNTRPGTMVNSVSEESLPMAESIRPTKPGSESNGCPSLLWGVRGGRFGGEVIGF
ncbi:hypothetical protein IC575_002376 [Cucumis melo]